MTQPAPTPEQEAIFAHQRAGSGPLMVEALPGTGKTTTLVMLAQRTPPVMTLSLAFNKKIAEEMTLRFPSHIESSTLNSLGHRAWGRHLATRLTLDARKSYALVKAEVDKLSGRDKDDAYAAFSDLLRAVDKSRLLGWVPDGAFPQAQRIIDDEDCFQIMDDEFLDGFPPLFEQILRTCVTASIQQALAGVVDFNDQVYMPVLFGASFSRYPRVLVDEVQDLSLLNHMMLAKVLAPSATLIAVGDHWQSIYAFRGAATDSTSCLREQHRMDTLPLSISFRCPRAVIRLARNRAPNMQWPEWASEGEVTCIEDAWDASTIAPNSAIICRNNAPLFRTALYLLRNKRGCRLLKSDIGASLVKLLKKIGAGTTSRTGLLSAIEAWRLDKISKVKEDKAGIINDRAECLSVFAEEGTDLTSAVAYAEHLFSSTGTIDLMSGHAAKGLEYNTVYHLDSHRIPSKHAIRAQREGNPGPMEQELNLRFIITTRAKSALHFINSKPNEPDHA